LFRKVIGLISGHPAIERPDDEHPSDAGEEIPSRPVEIIHAGFKDRETDEIRPLLAEKIQHKDAPQRFL
jgi:hypothetical protein